MLVLYAGFSIKNQKYPQSIYGNAQCLCLIGSVTFDVSIKYNMIPVEVLGSHLSTGSNLKRFFFKGPMGRCKGRCKATTPSSFSLTSNRVTTNY